MNNLCFSTLENNVLSAWWVLVGALFARWLWRRQIREGKKTMNKGVE